MYNLLSLKSHPIDAIKPAVLGTVFPKRPITIRPEKDADGRKCQHVQYISVHHRTEKSGICNMETHSATTKPMGYFETQKEPRACQQSFNIVLLADHNAKCST